MSAPPRRRRDRRGTLHARGSVAARRPQLPLVLVYCIGAIALLASAGRTLTTKVDARAVTDGDTITVYVSMDDHTESDDLPLEVRGAAIQRAKARATKNYQKSDALQKILLDAGYRQVTTAGSEQVLVKKYRIRLSGIDAPEISMPYGKEAKEELVRLVQGKSLKISVYYSDRYGRLVGDVDCNGVFVQWENQAKMSQTGLWASAKPEKPWEWREQKRIRTV
ncbi:hypothetical protein EJB05_31330, partial [Eragrostis curvula]